MAINLNKTPSKLARGLTVAGLFGLLAAFASPTASAEKGIAEPVAPAAMTDDDDPPCEEEHVIIEIDTSNGDVYVYDPIADDFVLSDNSINVHFGSLSSVLIELRYSTDEWDVEVDDGASSRTLQTSGGVLRHYITTGPTQYVFSSSLAATGASAMNMAPVPPGDIIIIPKPTCPPD